VGSLALLTVGILIGFSLGVMVGIMLSEAADAALDKWDFWK
jgi:ABC-type phosphate transport system permease subunit